MKGLTRLGLGLVALSVACTRGSAVGPAPGIRGLAIALSFDTLYVGQQLQLSVLLDGRPVKATWTSSDDRIVDIDSTAMIRGVAIGSATIAAVVDNERATVNVRVVPDYRGRFAGRIEQTRCQRISGMGPLSDCQGGIPYRINALTIDEQRGANISGTLNLFLTPSVGPVEARLSRTTIWS